jgi:hypothetical protein
MNPGKMGNKLSNLKGSPLLNPPNAQSMWVEVSADDIGSVKNALTEMIKANNKIGESTWGVDKNSLSIARGLASLKILGMDVHYLVESCKKKLINDDRIPRDHLTGHYIELRKLGLLTKNKAEKAITDEWDDYKMWCEDMGDNGCLHSAYCLISLGSKNRPSLYESDLRDLLAKKAVAEDWAGYAYFAHMMQTTGISVEKDLKPHRAQLLKVLRTYAGEKKWIAFADFAATLVDLNLLTPNSESDGLHRELPPVKKWLLDK